MSRKLQVAISGLGRMGARHALNFHTRTPRAEVVAAFSPDPKERSWAHANLEGARIYDDYDEMLKHPGLEAVVVSTVTTAHAEQAIKAIEADKHVLCEKPLSTSVEVVSAPGMALMCWRDPADPVLAKIVPVRPRRRQQETPPQGLVRLLPTL